MSTTVSKLGLATGESARTIASSSATQSLSSEVAAAVGSGNVSQPSLPSSGGISSGPVGPAPLPPSQPPITQPSPPSGETGGRPSPQPPIETPILLPPPLPLHLPSPPFGGRININPVGPTPPITFPIPISRPTSQPPIRLPILPLPIIGNRRPTPQPPIHFPISTPPQPLPPGAGHVIRCLGPECRPIQWPIGPIQPPNLQPERRIWIGPPPVPIHRGPYNEREINYWRQIIENAARSLTPAQSLAQPTVEHITVGGPATVGNVIAIARPVGRAQVTSLGAPSAVVRTATQGQVATAGGVATAENVQNPLLTRYLNEVYAPVAVQTVGRPTTIVARRTVGNVGTRTVGNVQGGMTISGPQGSVYIPAQQLLAAATG